jgi:osmotically-inducible protein OsmY
MKRTTVVICALFAAGCSTSKPADYPNEATGTSPSPRAGAHDDSMATRPGPTTPTTGTADGAAAKTPGKDYSGNKQPSNPSDVRAMDASTTSTGTTGAGRQPDNTEVNKGDASGAALTPMDQSNAKGDIDITAEIRRSLVGDGALSTMAKNVKVITVKGKVTLRGPVKSAEERAKVEAAAKRVAGDAQVDSQLEVKTN